MHSKDEGSFYVHGKTYKFSKMSLGILENKSKFRIMMVWLVTNRLFDNFIMCMILINSMFLGIKNYKDVENTTPKNQFIERMEPFFQQVFLIECVCKVIAMGFVMDNKSYLSEAWN